MLYCESCEAEAVEKVLVSEESYADSTRWYCYTCYEVFLVGAQHGSYRARAGKDRESVEADTTDEEDKELEEEGD